MKPQEIFDTVVRHMSKQGCRAMRDDTFGPVCAYENEAGQRCAVGVLLSDPEALKFVGSVRRMKSVGLLPEELHDHIDLLDSLQLAHDEEDTGINLKYLLLTIARDFNLNNSIVVDLHWPEEWL